MKPLEVANLVEDGNITKAFMTETDYRVEDIIDSSTGKATDYQSITPKNYFDPSIITENPVVQKQFSDWAYGQVTANSIDENVASLRSNFGAKISRDQWSDMVPESQVDFIVDLLNDKAIEEAKGSKLETQTELYDRRNNKVVTSNQLKSLAKKANMSEQDYIKQNLEIKYYTFGKTFERKKPTEKEVKDKAVSTDISYIEDIRIPIQQGPALQSGKRPVDLVALENDVLNKQGFQVVKAEAVGGVDKIVITKSIAGTDNKAVITEDMTPPDRDWETLFI